jgi:hypothetical protein
MGFENLKSQCPGIGFYPLQEPKNYFAGSHSASDTQA